MKYQFYVGADGKAEPAGTSNVPLAKDGYGTVEAEITDAQLAKIDAKYEISVSEGKVTFAKGKAAEDYAAEKSSARKSEIIERLGVLKIQKDGLSILGEPTGEQDAEIRALKEEFSSVI